MTKADSLSQGTEEQANSEGSDSSVINKGSSQPEFLTVDQFKQLLASELEARRRQEQSAKDKSIKQANERLTTVETDLRKLLQRASQEGKSAGDVLAEIRQQEQEENAQLVAQMAKAWRDGRFPQQVSQGSETKEEVDILEVIEDFGLDTEDKRVAALATQSFETIEAAEQAVVGLIKRINKRPAPSNAERPSREGEASRPSTNQEKLLAEYREQAKSKRGNALIALKMEYRKKGLDIS